MSLRFRTVEGQIWEYQGAQIQISRQVELGSLTGSQKVLRMLDIPITTQVPAGNYRPTTKVERFLGL